MSESILPILSNPAVLERTSPATRRALEMRAHAAPHVRFLGEIEYALLQSIVMTILPQGQIGTDVDITDAIDKRLADGTTAGWRFAELPVDGEAYRRGLQVFAAMLEQTPMKTFDRMPPPAREGYLRCVANGDVDGPAQFALSKWLLMLKTDVVNTWMAHPAVMQKIEYYGFADGAEGTTDGPTPLEGWNSMTPNKALPLEQGIQMPAGEREA